MHISALFFAGFANQALADFWIGGYGGELISGDVANPGVDNVVSPYFHFKKGGWQVLTNVRRETVGLEPSLTAAP